MGFRPWVWPATSAMRMSRGTCWTRGRMRSEEHTSELQSQSNLVCRLLLDPSTPEIHTLSLHDALPIFDRGALLDLHEAAATGHLERVRELSTPENVNSASADGFQALGLACYFGHEDVARYLLDAGADEIGRAHV